MKKTKLNLEDFQVRSFVTELDDALLEAVKAGMNVFEEIETQPKDGAWFCSVAGSACGGRGCGSYPTIPGWNCGDADEVPVDGK